MDGLNKFIYEIGSDSAFSILARSNELIKQGKEVINLGIGQPDFPTAPNIVESAVKALRDGNHGYSSSNGILELREAVAHDFFNRNNIKIDPNDILITPGGKAVILAVQKNERIDILIRGKGPLCRVDMVLNHSGSRRKFDVYRRFPASRRAYTKATNLISFSILNRLREINQARTQQIS